MMMILRLARFYEVAPQLIELNVHYCGYESCLSNKNITVVHPRYEIYCQVDLHDARNWWTTTSKPKIDPWAARVTQIFEVSPDTSIVVEIKTDLLRAQSKAQGYLIG